jgi:hypothetical protein
MAKPNHLPMWAGGPIRLSLLALTLGLLQACESGFKDATFAHRDTPGVAIVESAAPVWDGGEGFGLLPENESVSTNVLRGILRLV